MEFEKAWEDKNSHKAYALLKQYSGKIKRCSPVLNTANGVAIVRTPAECAKPFEVVTGVTQGARPFLFNFAIDDVMRRIVDLCPDSRSVSSDIIPAPSGRPLSNADDVVIFAKSSTNLQHVVNLI
ncbi:hypothetical protein RB195_002026 [Necator americanus]|uniref:Reverse transcriptase domain-containing protein n=1 Tax=Necator americanus TaxID=51031 RepID=A0ABR1DJX6_NECAM